MPVEGLETFQSTIHEFASNLDANVVVPFQQKIAFQVLRGVTLRTPVGLRERWAANIKRAEKGLPPLPKGYIGGHHRGNWQATIGEIPSNEVPGVDPGGASTIERGLAVLNEIKGFTVAYVTNNAPAIEVLEHGHSKVAPNGMVAVTLAEVQTQFNAE